MEAYKQQQGQAHAQAQAQLQAAQKKNVAQAQAQQQAPEKLAEQIRNFEQQQSAQAQAQTDGYALLNHGHTQIDNTLALGLRPLGMGQLGGEIAVAQSSASHSRESDGVGQIHGVMRGRKRGMDGDAKKNVNQRQQRLIKKKEWAAKYRAGQQYILELRAQLARLQREDELWEESWRARQQYILELEAKVALLRREEQLRRAKEMALKSESHKNAEFCGALAVQV